MSSAGPTGLRRRALLSVGLGVPFAAHAETYPNKPIRVVLPGPVGGLIDITGRAISDSMQRELGQPWMIDPRPGANGNMAGQMFLSAPSDGYTLFFTVSGIMALPFIMKVPFNTVVQLSQLGQRYRRAPAARAAQDQVRPRYHLDFVQWTAARCAGPARPTARSRNGEHDLGDAARQGRPP
ncbi:MAG: hypothetical protein KIS73_05925 [Enhydrobacter sp.]|nr:hypothetical protein [Enhydrobacter sp.]